MNANTDLKFARLLTVVFLLTVLATAVAHLFPLAVEVRFLGLLLDIVPVAGVFVASVIVAIRLKRLSLPVIRLFVAVSNYFAGALIGTLGVAHLVAVIIAAMDRSFKNQFIYDFRFYSLIQLGVFLIVAGFMAAIKAADLARGERAAWRASLLVWIAVLAINLPLVPLQGFAILFSVLAALELLILAGTRRHFEVKQNSVMT